MNMMCSSRIHLSLFLFTTSFFSIHTTDTIDTSHTLSDNRDDTLISSNGDFALGFFSPGSSKNRYVGIWYNNIKDKTVVWIANRDNPLTDRSGTLRVVQPGGPLLLLNATNATIWSANVSSSSLRTPLARLLDTGNLIVTDANDDNNFIWQSFDYPTDTLLAGMKLGKNLVTGHELYISSAKSNDDPATGGFTYRCDPTGYPQMVIKEGASIRYKTGPWNGFWFSGSRVLTKSSIFSFGLVMNWNEVYYYYNLLNDSVYTRLTINGNGFVQRWMWFNQTQNWMLYLSVELRNCDTYNICGAYGVCGNTTNCSCLNEFEPTDPGGDFSNGCIRRTPFNCQDGNVFLKYSGIKLPDTERSWYNASMSLEECKVACSTNCSCTAYASPNINNGERECLLWFGDLVDLREMSPGQDIYIRMAKSGLDSGSRKREILIVTLSLVIGILMLGLSLLLFYQKRKQQEKDRLRHSFENHDELELPMFELSTIIKATDGFSIHNKLGEGGFGPVFKPPTSFPFSAESPPASHDHRRSPLVVAFWNRRAHLATTTVLPGLLGGQEIAVKRLSTTSQQGVDEFKNEVICIGKLQHRNLVKLLGYCIQGVEIMLVYEYMTNKSLNFILFDQVKGTILDWPRRFNIINGIARGLMYLHQDSRLRIIHRDLKASNILLDSDMIPKISDFGLARTCGSNETGAKTSRVVGTYGYMSPEYAIDGIFSVKSDVFSFGVLVLEIISGKRNRGFSMVDHSHNLLGHAWMLYKEERSLELVDSCVEYSSYLSQVARSIHVGLLCVQEQTEERPNMSSVVLMLNNDGVLPEAKHPGFFTARDIIRTETSNNSNTASSNNTMTISLLEAR